MNISPLKGERYIMGTTLFRPRASCAPLPLGKKRFKILTKNPQPAVITHGNRNSGISVDQTSRQAYCNSQ